MALGGDSFDKSGGNIDKRTEHLMREADIDRAAKEAGHLSALQRFKRWVRRPKAD